MPWVVHRRATSRRVSELSLRFVKRRSISHAARSQGIKSPPQGRCFRRSANLVLYWQDEQFVFENFARQIRISADPLTCSLLHYCAEWRTFAEICSFLGEFDDSSIRASLKQLCANRMLEIFDGEAPQPNGLQDWTGWNPAAGFFHFSTKDFPFAENPLEDFRGLRRLAKHHPMPVPLKRYAHSRKTKLPRGQFHEQFPKVLKDRRTWRMFGKHAVPLEALAEILRLTFGIQGWVQVPGLGRAAMKTSPSCGCLHPIEAYVLALRVKGLRKGFYHYDAQRHELEWLREGVTRKVLEKNIGHQWWFAKSAFLIVMTAVFGRTRWKYKFPRVYRGILLEAGHLGQTFCLTATWKGLAPFSTIAYQDTQWEKWLGLDGISESVLYLAGAGTRPTDLKNAHMGALRSA